MSTDERNAWNCGEPDGKPCTVQSCPWCGANKPTSIVVIVVIVKVA